MNYEVLISKQALKQLNNLEKEIQNRIKEKLRVLKKDPYKSGSKVDIKKLTGSYNPKLYRLRIGDYRIIYALTNNEIKITEIIRRSKGYKFLGK